MIKHLILAGLLTVGTSAAYAQQATTPPRAADPQVAAMPSGDDAKKLIGRNVKNLQNETVGEIESVYISADGKIDSVILGVGGFLGMGERHVRVAWKDLRISDNGEKVAINATKDQLKGMPPYTYLDAKLRGQVFSDTGPYTAPAPADRTASTTATESTGDFNANGAISGNALIGAKVHNAAKETVGSIEDVYVDAKGAIESVVVSVGGFLGVGNKHVAVKWSDLKVGRDGKSLMLTTGWTKDSLKAMPDYKYERRKPVRQGG
jgi:sporulation protein YlmC with PRC-barrel domain/ketosteroid isomerase-like protein